jgi:uroporphyrinogen decarboxylase
MNRKERFLKAINHEEPDRVPYDTRFTPEARIKLIEHFELTKKYGDSIRTISTNGAEVDYLAVEMGHDFLLTHLGPITGYYQGDGSGTYADEFGIVRRWVRTPDGAAFTEIVDPPLKTLEDVKAYALPDFEDERRYDTARQVIKEFGRDFGIMAGIPCTLFELAWYLRGMQRFLMDWASEKEFVHDYLNKLKRWVLVAGNIFAELGVDVIWIGDDVGNQQHMLVSPESWREYIKPIYTELFASWKRVSPNVKVAFHSDGYIEPIIPDLIEIGVDILNPIQPTCTDPEFVKEKYGDRLTLWGTVDNQHVMPLGTPDDVEQEVKLRIRQCAAGGGFLISPTHRIQPQTSVENIVRFYETVKECGTYPIERY